MSHDRFDVLERFESLFEAPEPSFELFLRRRHRKLRNQRIAAGVVAVAVLVALVVSLATVLPSEDSEVPADTVPTAPPRLSDELVVSVWSHPFAGGGNVHVRVYADGRLLRARGSEDSWTEQRLTPEGLDLLRSEIISTDMFDPDRPVPDSGEWPNPNAAPGTLRGIVEVRNGDRFVKVHCCWGPALDWWPEFERLIDRLRDPESWLPDGVWENREGRAYVPSRYAICLEGPDIDPQPLEPSPLLTSLPAPAIALLGRARHWMEAGDVGGVTRAARHCFDVDTYDAREFFGAVEATGAERRETGVDFDAGPDVGTVYIWSVPYLPDGQLGSTPG